MGQDKGLALGNGQESSCHLFLQPGLSAKPGTSHKATQIISVFWQITFLTNIYYFGSWCYTLDTPRVSGQQWLSQRGERRRSQACLQPRPWCEAGDGAEPPCAAAATSLLNYINRPPSSVIFYYMGKKKKKTGWAGKSSYFHSANSSKQVIHRSSHETFIWRLLGSPLPS